MVAYRGMGGSRTATQSGVPVTGTAFGIDRLILQVSVGMPARDPLRDTESWRGGSNC